MSQSKKGKKALELVNAVYPPVLLIMVLLIGWESICRINEVPTWLLAKPSEIITVFFKNSGEILPYIRSTYLNIIIGYLLAIIVGVGLAMLFASYDVIGNAVTPVMIAICCIPMITLVPTLMLAFGTGDNVKIITIVIQTFPIVNMNATVAFLNVDKTRLELMKSLKATKIQTFRYCILRDAIPGIFTGIKLACIMAVLGGVSAEITGGNSGLGNRISYYVGFSRTAEALSCVIYIIFLGSILYALASLLEKKFIKE